MASKTKGDLRGALDALNERITAGEEFPDACWRVTQDWGVDHDALRDAYDAQFEQVSARRAA
jgi:hypothetical protein